MNAKVEDFIKKMKEEQKAKDAEAKFEKQICLGRGVLSFFVAAIVLCSLPLIDKFAGDFYNKHQLVCNLGWSVFALVLFVLFGFDKLKVGNFLKIISKRLVMVLAKIKVIRNYQNEAVDFRENKDRFLREAMLVQDKIDEKLGTKEERTKH